MTTRAERAIYRGLIAATVGVLGWLLLPVSEEARGGGAKTACLSNMKQIGLAAIIYASDSDETLPLGRTTTGPTAVGWAERMTPYTKNPDVYRCPSDVPGAPVSYALNANAAALPKLADATAPAQSVLFCEIANARAGRGGTIASARRLSPVGDGALGGFLDSTDLEIAPTVRPATGPLANSGLPAGDLPRHDARANYGFLDSHAKALAPPLVSAGANARAAKDLAAPTGGLRPDLPGADRPRAQGAGLKTGGATFSLR